MKYKAIIETDDYTDFIFFEDGNGKYLRAMDITGAVNSEWIALYFTECKQEPIFDKIRAEIKAMSGDIETIADALAIIDKYKAEIEPYESEENNVQTM